MIILTSQALYFEKSFQEAKMRVWMGDTNVSCQLKFWLFVSCQLNLRPFVSCQLIDC